MKLKNRIMSWLLSPGAYALWHSMGNPDEWKWDDRASRFYNSNANLRLKMTLWWVGAPLPVLVIPPLTIIVFVLWAIWPFLTLHCEDYEDGIGWVDRHLIAGRAMRLRTKLLKRDAMSRKQRQNRAIFSKLTVNQVGE